ncbi:class I glutamine amidotransferase-like protein [Dichomitus squalens]|uniref:Class I glutamine amidotransferase-like protein n=1 Tax=Dichomitus squalens TaxID=114155 RepID=A0A4Q9M8V5_9APHY|nr:class I glutamine amidotransferase-like protein [Dichomitus squalens]
MSSSPKKPFRIAVLLCDTPIEPVVAAQGDYGQIFRTLFRKSLEATQAKEEDGLSDFYFAIDAFDVRTKLEYPENVDEYDAVLLTGSAASAYENLTWINRLIDYVKYLAEEKPKIRLIGICFGHQIIARALGGECVPNDGRWEVGPTPLQLTETGKKLFGVPELVSPTPAALHKPASDATYPSFLLRLFPQNIQQMHRDHVPAAPPSFYLLGSTPISPNQGMVKLYPGGSPESVSPADVHIFTVQGHPEFTQFIVDEIVKARSSTGVIGKDIVEDVQRRRDLRNDGVEVVGKTLWDILRASRA